ncbi:MAG: hypothetical protein QME79_14185 [Bacillota bacterium]|nr:hypothetical protein [Bacillota bacterium]
MASLVLGVSDLIIYDIIRVQQPWVLVELRRRRLLRWRRGGEVEETVMVDGRPYRDVTEEATETAVGAGAPPGHDAYRRIRGAIRQVRWA